jgi:hypothetical protein
MGDYANLTAAVAADLATITGAGVVLDSAPLPPLVEDWETFLDTFTAEIDGVRKVRAWTVAFVGTEPIKEARRGYDSMKVLRDIRLLIRFHLAREHPSSEATFRDLIESAARKLDSDPGLGGAALDTTPVTVNVQDGSILLGSVLCHYGEMSLTARIETTVP